MTIQQATVAEARVFIAEGVETALSLKDAGLRGKIIASLGVHNIKNYEGSEKEVIICADHDNPASRTSEVIQQARQHFQIQALHKHAPEIAKEMERVIQRQQSKGFER